METLGLVFILLKIADAARVVDNINVLVLGIYESIDLLLIFLLFLVVINIVLVPLAQAIWGTYLIGYKTFSDAMVSVFMIAYSKGNLEILLEINTFWSLIFMLIYYLLPIFILHAAFHNS